MATTLAFPGLNAVPENADIFASELFSNCSKNTAISVQAITSAMNGANGSERITVYGSDISGNFADMVAIKDEYGTAGAITLASLFEREYFPFKYIGIKYTHGTNSGTGTVTILYNQTVTGVSIS